MPRVQSLLVKGISRAVDSGTCARIHEAIHEASRKIDSDSEEGGSAQAASPNATSCSPFPRTSST